MPTEHSRSRGFTLIEIMVAITIFASGSVYFFSTFAQVTRSSQTTGVSMDLGAQNKKALTRLYNELQATSGVEHDTDGADATPPEAVFTVTSDAGAPRPSTAARPGVRVGGVPVEKEGVLQLGAGKEQAREKSITLQSRLRFRKVVGYMFKQSSGSILPEWSGWITYRVDGRRRLIRESASGKSSIVARRVDAFDVASRPDGTVVVTIVTARPNPDGSGMRRYANSVSVFPKN